MTDWVSSCPRQLVRVCVLLWCVTDPVSVRLSWLALCRLGSIMWKRPTVLVT